METALVEGERRASIRVGSTLAKVLQDLKIEQTEAG